MNIRVQIYLRYFVLLIWQKMKLESATSRCLMYPKKIAILQIFSSCLEMNNQANIPIVICVSKRTQNLYKLLQKSQYWAGNHHGKSKNLHFVPWSDFARKFHPSSKLLDSWFWIWRWMWRVSFTKSIIKIKSIYMKTKYFSHSEVFHLMDPNSANLWKDKPIQL